MPTHSSAVRWAIIASGLCMAIVVASLWPPRLAEVQGVSMGPGLLPGDVVGSTFFPAADRLRRPGRYERWVVRDPDGDAAVKRVVAGDGESLAIEEGDLAIDGRVMPKAPGVLAELATGVAVGFVANGAADAPSVAFDRTSWRFEAPVVYDDARFAPEEKRWLVPVRDVGLAGIVRLAPVRTTLSCRVGEHRMRWSPQGPGFAAVVAGRLDRHIVAVAWLIDSRFAAVVDPWNASTDPGRLAQGGPWFPAGLPDAWSITLPVSTVEGQSVRLAIDVTGDGAEVVTSAVWRDVHHLPSDSRDRRWRIPDGEWFLLGDHPPASLDSRQWGPLPRDRLWYRVDRLP